MVTTTTHRVVAGARPSLIIRFAPLAAMTPAATYQSRAPTPFRRSQLYSSKSRNGHSSSHSFIAPRPRWYPTRTTITHPCRLLYGPRLINLYAGSEARYWSEILWRARASASMERVNASGNQGRHWPVLEEALGDGDANAMVFAHHVRLRAWTRCCGIQRALCLGRRAAFRRVADVDFISFSKVQYDSRATGHARFVLCSPSDVLRNRGPSTQPRRRRQRCAERESPSRGAR
ncbi:hypothetical protein B0H14DRAFT_2823394 [Mycena olivaceomarginata]|nr:hypothetical protein B0H14DRAFT_2823394 [Mycena olivaceomarginata]